MNLLQENELLWSVPEAAKLARCVRVYFLAASTVSSLRSLNVSLPLRTYEVCKADEKTL